LEGAAIDALGLRGFDADKELVDTKLGFDLAFKLVVQGLLGL
jgi:hypothetical protein